jgi:hypothetical protein
MHQPGVGLMHTDAAEKEYKSLQFNESEGFRVQNN